MPRRLAQRAVSSSVSFGCSRIALNHLCSEIFFTCTCNTSLLATISKVQIIEMSNITFRY
jgi:hypothetical protein